MSLTRMEDEFQANITIEPVARNLISITLGQYSETISIIRPNNAWPPSPEEPYTEEELLAEVQYAIDRMSEQIAKDDEWQAFVDEWTSVD